MLVSCAPGSMAGSTASSLLLLLILAMHCLCSAAAAPQQQHHGGDGDGDASWGDVEHVPGWPDGQPLPSRWSSGYLSVGGGRRHLFYLLVESERDPASDPVVLWLNGGPGCSSFDGFVYEHGPALFRFEPPPGGGRGRRVSLAPNPHSWSKAATVIYLDSPAAVGLSYADADADYATNDTQTAADVHAAVLALLRREPRLRHNDFFVAGESYAGVYVPLVARAIADGNDDARGPPRVNLRGYLVGNGVTDARFDGEAAFAAFAAGKSLISAGLASRLRGACEGGAGGYDAPTPRCAALLAEAHAATARLNLYDVLEPCYDGSGGSSKGSGNALAKQKLAALLAASRFEWPLGGAVRNGSRVRNLRQLLGHNPPCTDASLAEQWLNDEETRAALHAAPTSRVTWALCSDRIAYDSDAGSMLPVHAELTRRRGLRALIYSGDHDMCVPHTGSEAWTSSMHNAADVAAGWRAWLSPPGQVAGYAVRYASGLTYATIKGAGHMVPENKPRQALDMFARFLEGRDLDDDGGDTHWKQLHQRQPQQDNGGGISAGEGDDASGAAQV